MKDILVDTLISIVILVGYVIFMGIVLRYINNKSHENIQKSLGRKGVFITSLLGTPIHEIGHAIMCLIFRHKITKVKLLQFKSEDGTLGYVKHSWNKNSIYQSIGNFFIALGPIYSGIITVSIATLFINSDVIELIKGIEYSTTDIKVYELCKNSIDIVRTIIGSLDFKSIKTYMYIYICTSVSSHVSLSDADLKGMNKGLYTIIVLLLIFNVISHKIGVNSLEHITKINIVNNYMLTFMLIIMVFSILNYVISTITCGVKGIIGGKSN